VWKKKETDPPTTSPQPRPEPPAPRPAPAPPRRTERAVIGPTLRIHGEVTGEEELLIQGQIDGKIVVKGQAVTVGKSGKVKADIHARTVRVEGTVRGDLFGEQEVIIETSGDVHGNLIAPGVRLENGAKFKGSIDMERANNPQPSVPAAMPAPPGTSAVGQPGSTGATDEKEKAESAPSAPGHPTLRP